MEHLWSLSNMTRVHVDSGLPYGYLKIKIYFSFCTFHIFFHIFCRKLIFDKKCLYDYKTNGPRSSEIFFEKPLFYGVIPSTFNKSNPPRSFGFCLNLVCMLKSTAHMVTQRFFILIRENVIEF